MTKIFRVSEEEILRNRQRIFIEKFEGVLLKSIECLKEAVNNKILLDDLYTSVMAEFLSAIEQSSQDKRFSEGDVIQCVVVALEHSEHVATKTTNKLLVNLRIETAALLTRFWRERNPVTHEVELRFSNR